MVNSLVPNGAAELSAAQLSTGDKLLAIDGVDVLSMNASKKVMLIFSRFLFTVFSRENISVGARSGRFCCDSAVRVEHRAEGCVRCFNHEKACEAPLDRRRASRTVS